MFFRSVRGLRLLLEYFSFVKYSWKNYRFVDTYKAKLPKQNNFAKSPISYLLSF